MLKHGHESKTKLDERKAEIIPVVGILVLDLDFCLLVDILVGGEGSLHNLLGVEDIQDNLLVGEAVPKK